MGSADIQSLADLGNSFEFVRNMRPFPVDRNSIIPIVVATALPMLPLVLTVYPFDELILKIVVSCSRAYFVCYGLSLFALGLRTL